MDVPDAEQELPETQLPSGSVCHHADGRVTFSDGYSYRSWSRWVWSGMVLLVTGAVLFYLTFDGWRNAWLDRDRPLFATFSAIYLVWAVMMFRDALYRECVTFSSTTMSRRVQPLHLIFGCDFTVDLHDVADIHWYDHEHPDHEITENALRIDAVLKDGRQLMLFDNPFIDRGTLCALASPEHSQLTAALCEAMRRTLQQLQTEEPHTK